MDFTEFFQLKGLKSKNKGHTNFYDCCDFDKKSISKGPPYYTIAGHQNFLPKQYIFRYMSFQNNYTNVC